MAARDVFHKAVKEALIKDQWQITDDPLVLQVGGVDMYVDLGAERLLAAEKDHQQIAVEVKSFLGPSLIRDFHLALGQFINYRLALAQQDPQRRLYLAIPLETHSRSLHSLLSKLLPSKINLRSWCIILSLRR